MTKLFILSGFLGSGKTSALKYAIEVMTDTKGTVVVVNEAGELGLDGKLVERAGIPVRELNNGCVCCSLQVDFIALLNEMFKTEPPSKLLIEASGLAEPAMLAKTLARFDGQIQWRKTIVVLDAEIWETREAQGDFFYAQLNSADLILLSKADLYAADQVAVFLSEIRQTVPGTPIEIAIHGRVNPKIFLERPNNIKNPDQIPESHDLSAFQNVSIESADTMDGDKWKRFIQEEGANYVRIKGQLELENGPAYFDFVRGHSNWSPPLESVSGNRLVFIGRDLDPHTLQTKLESLVFQRGSEGTPKQRG
ncbi:MAG: GTP-binding protein [Deltaproteobacteria bacterium]|nr:GTP-binding protein [Deltaproteobacteria bacterium]